MGRLGLVWRPLRSSLHLQSRRVSRPSDTNESQQESCSHFGIEEEISEQSPQQHKAEGEESREQETECPKMVSWEECKMDEVPSLRYRGGNEEARYSVFESSAPRQDEELQDRLEAIIALKSLVNHQRKTISSLRKRNREYKRKVRRRNDGKWTSSSLSLISEDGSSLRSSVYEEDPRKYTVSFGPSLERSDIEVLSVISFEDFESCDLEHMEEEFRDAANEIRKQASQVEAAIVLDKLETTEAELKRVSQELDKRSQELGNVQLELANEKERVSEVEQERALLQAEAMQTKEHLNTCISYMTNLGVNLSHDVQGEHLAVLPSETSSESLSAGEEEPSSPSKIHLALRMVKSGKRENKCNSKTIEPSCDSALGGTDASSDPAERTSMLNTSATANRIKRLEWSPYGDSNETPSSHGRTEKSRHNIGSPRNKSSGWFKHSKNHVANDSKNTERRKRDKKHLRLHRKKGSVDGAIVSQGDTDENPLTSTSTTASTIDQYYKNVVTSLQEKIVDLKTEKKRLEMEMVTRLATVDQEKRTAVNNLEAELQMRNAYIEKLENEVIILRHDISDSHALAAKRSCSPRRFC